MAEARSDSKLKVVEALNLQQKVRSSKKILGLMTVLFVLLSVCTSWAEQMNRVFTLIAVVSSYHFIFHVWCDNSDLSTTVARHEHHVYLVMLSNFLIMTVAIPYNAVFTRAVAILVMPLMFTRETQSIVVVSAFLVLHAALTAYLLWNEMQDDGMQWLASLTIVDAGTVDVAAMRIEAVELGNLLQEAYESCQHVSSIVVKTLLGKFCNVYVVIDDEMKLAERSPKLNAMLGKEGDNRGEYFEDFVYHDDRQELRDCLQDWLASQVDQNSPEVSIITNTVKMRMLNAVDGRCVFALLFFAKLWGPDGDYIQYIGICDLWHKKRRPGKTAANQGTSSEPKPENCGTLSSNH